MNRLTVAERARRDTDSALIQLAITLGTVKVKRCPSFAPTRFPGKRGGGMLPPHLSPITIGDTLEEVEQRQRELIAAPSNAAVSRKIRVRGR